jgi:isoquinoline 1-oxidoreductase subunit beta
VCAVDCGTPINPDVITAQMEGGIGFGLGAVLYGAITLEGWARRAGQLQQLSGACA